MNRWRRRIGGSRPWRMPAGLLSRLALHPTWYTPSINVQSTCPARNRAVIMAEQLDATLPMAQYGPAVQVRAAVGVVGTIVAGMPPSAEQPRRDPSARSPRLTAISEAEPMAVDAPDAQLESQPSQAASKAAGKGGKKAGAGGTQATTARKRSAPAAQPETVPEQNERRKRRKRSPAAKPDAAAEVDELPSEGTALGKGGNKAAAVLPAAAAAEDDAAANPEPGDITAVVPLLAPSLSRGMRI